MPFLHMPVPARFRQLPLQTVLFAIALLAGNAARADLVTNGNFETGSLSGWTATGNVGVWNNAAARSCCYTGDSGTDVFAAFGGGNTADNGVLSQSLATVAGDYYNLTFLFGGGGTAGYTQSIEVQFAGLDVTLSSPTTSNLSALFSSYSYVVRATGTSTLTFSDRSTVTYGVDPFLDNVSVLQTTAPIPEPAVPALMAAGLALLRRGRRSA